MAVQAHYHHHHHRESPFLVSGGGGTPESSRLAAAMELHQAQKEAMAPQQAPPLFLDFSHGGNQIKQIPPWLRRFRLLGHPSVLHSDLFVGLLCAQRLRRREEAAARGGVHVAAVLFVAATTAGAGAQVNQPGATAQAAGDGPPAGLRRGLGARVVHVLGLGVVPLLRRARRAARSAQERDGPADPGTCGEAPARAGRHSAAALPFAGRRGGGGGCAADKGEGGGGLGGRAARRRPGGPGGAAEGGGGGVAGQGARGPVHGRGAPRAAAAGGDRGAGEGQGRRGRGQRGRRRRGGRRRVLLRRPGQGGGDRPTAAAGAGQVVPDVQAALGLRRAAPVPPPVRLCRVRARRPRRRRPLRCRRRRRRCCLPHVPWRGHRHGASVPLVASIIIRGEKGEKVKKKTGAPAKMNGW